jgi:preprotein translocase subunit SecD
MNRYPLWKYAILVVALLLGVIYTLPNFFGEAPAVQVSSAKATIKVDTKTLQRVEDALKNAGIVPRLLALEGNSVRARFDTTDLQLRAKDAIQNELVSDITDPSYVVALNLVSRTPSWLSALHASPMYLGLDLRGGVHFMLQVDMQAAQNKAVETALTTLRAGLRESSIRNVRANIKDQTISVEVSSNFSEKSQLRNLLDEKLPLFKCDDQARDSDGGFRINCAFTPKQALEIKSQAVKQNIETLHKRVNQLGVAEPVIQQQGIDRIVVQLPGVQDTARAKSILGKTATLQIRLVEDAGNFPAETVIQRQADGSNRSVGLKREVIVSGDQVDKASATFDQNQRPAVSVDLNAQGGRAMRTTTRQNINKQMAIVLYEKNKGEAVSVATIQGEFGNGFQITGNFSPEETADLALLIRAGSLAAPMEIIEERTIGPSLGAENIAKGFNSVTWGFLVIVAFMMVYYAMFGLFSGIALGVNLLLLVAILSMLQATLTLPGMAAMALALGMAIDSNVLINERVREELRNGASPQAAIYAGYDRAWATIFDSNITTLIAGVALLVFGSGPVRGFAVVHCIGILTSMFSAVLFSRGLVNLWYGGQKKLKSVSIGTVWRPEPGTAVKAD